MKKSMRILGVMVCLVFLTSFNVWAGALTIPNTFVANDPAVAADVNENFTAVETAVDDNNSRITAVESGKQNRVTGICASGYSIRQINADGSVVCELDTDTNSGGDITSVTAGQGLTGGGTSGAVTLYPDTSYLQRRVTTACSTGYALRYINVDGTAVCEPVYNGDITGVTAGNYLTGGASSGNATLHVSGMPGIDYALVEKTSINVSNGTMLAYVAVNCPTTGYIVARFDGYAYVDDGDRLILAVSDTSGTWGVNSGHVEIYGVHASLYVQYPFSHTRVYQVTTAGIYKYIYANADHFSGDYPYTSVYGTLTAEFFPVRY